jgi:hypothetical protein
MIIDMHTHISNEKIYSEYKKKTKKISKIIVFQSWEEKTKEILNFALSKKDLFLIKYIDLEKNLTKQIIETEKLFKEKKIYGIKLYPGYKHFHANDKKIEPIIKLCEKYNKPLIFHAGEVNDSEGNSLLKFSHPIHIDEIATKFPKCKIIIAHFGYPHFIETATIVQKNKNVYVDISGTIDNCGKKREIKKLRKQYQKDLKRVLNYYPTIKKKIMFGTDYAGEESTLNLVEPYIKTVKNVFNKKEQKKVFYTTAEKLFFH